MLEVDDRAIWTREATIRWNAGDAAAVSISIRDPDGSGSSVPTNDLLVGERKVPLKRTGKYEVLLTATTTTGARAEARAHILRVRMPDALVPIAVLAAGLCAVAATAIWVGILPDQAERTGVGPLLKFGSAAASIASLLGGLPVVRALGSLVASPGSQARSLVASVQSRAITIGLGVFLVGLSLTALHFFDGLVAINTTDQTVAVSIGSRIVFFLPPGVTSIRPRTDTIAALEKHDDGLASLMPAHATYDMGDKHMTVRCADSFQVTHPAGGNVVLTLDHARLRPVNVARLAADLAISTFDIPTTCARPAIQHAARARLLFRENESQPLPTLLDIDLHASWLPPIPQDARVYKLAIQSVSLPVPFEDQVHATGSLPVAAGSGESAEPELTVTGECASRTCRVPLPTAMPPNLAWRLPTIMKEARWSALFWASPASWRDCQRGAAPACPLEKFTITGMQPQGSTRFSVEFVDPKALALGDRVSTVYSIEPLGSTTDVFLPPDWLGNHFGAFSFDAVLGSSEATPLPVSVDGTTISVSATAPRKPAQRLKLRLPENDTPVEYPP